jgi:uncharacterized membrane protein YbaN (DUF454 family)
MDNNSHLQSSRAPLTRLMRWLFVFLGLICVVLAYIGILLPGVPAIPFILLAAFFFLRSSEKLHAWMLRRKLLAKLLNKASGEKTSAGFKLFVISQLWVSITVACFLFIHGVIPIAITIVCGIGASFLTYRLMK